MQAMRCDKLQKLPVGRDNLNIPDIAMLCHVTKILCSQIERKQKGKALYS
jgi:hypothetical protein